MYEAKGHAHLFRCCLFNLLLLTSKVLGGLSGLGWKGQSVGSQGVFVLASVSELLLQVFAKCQLASEAWISQLAH